MIIFTGSKPYAATSPGARVHRHAMPKPVRRRSKWESIDMGIGAGILLIVAGAIMTFALNVTVQGIDLRVVGWILMLAGVAGLALFFIFWSRRRSARAVTAERDTYEVGEPRV
jgi:hypothetical protein